MAFVFSPFICCTTVLTEKGIWNQTCTSVWKERIRHHAHEPVEVGKCIAPQNLNRRNGISRSRSVETLLLPNLWPHGDMKGRGTQTPVHDNGVRGPAKNSESQNDKTEKERRIRDAYLTWPSEGTTLDY